MNGKRIDMLFVFGFIRIQLDANACLIGLVLLQVADARLPGTVVEHAPLHSQERVHSDRYG